MVNTEPRIISLLLFILFSAGIKLSKTEGVTNVKTGDTYSFKPNPDIKTKPYTILWKFNSDKLVEFEDGKADWFQFESQGNLNTETGVLTLSQMKEHQNGQYDSEIVVDSSGKTLASNYQIKVIDGLPVPKVTCRVATDGPITLQCSVPNSELAEYEWSGPDGLKREAMLIVSKDTKHESVYFCTVKNKVSQNTTEFPLKECFQEADPVNPVAIIVPSVVIPLVVILGVVCWKCRATIKEYLPVSNK